MVDPVIASVATRGVTTLVGAALGLKALAHAVKVNRAQSVLLAARVQTVADMLADLDQRRELVKVPGIEALLDTLMETVSRAEELLGDFASQTKWHRRLLSAGSFRSGFAEINARLSETMATLDLGLTLQQVFQEDKDREAEEADVTEIRGSLDQIIAMQAAEQRLLSDIYERQEDLAKKTVASLKDYLRTIVTAPQPPVLDRYQHLEIPYWQLCFQEQIGRGGFGVVYRGRYQNEEVAIKQLDADRLSAVTLKEFKNEIDVLSRITSRYIPRLYGICTEHGRYCIVMEYMARGNLSEVLRDDDVELPWPLRYRIALESARAMQLLYANNVQHRDLKSLNVLLDEYLHAKVSDFGLAKSRTGILTTATHSTGGGGKAHTAATLAWMAPERLTIGSRFTEACDVYSFGVTLYEIAARALPFDGEDPLIVRMSIKEGARPEIPDNTPPEFAALIRAAWAQQPASRPNFDELVRRLQDMYDRSASGAAGPIGVSAASLLPRALSSPALPSPASPPPQPAATRSLPRRRAPTPPPALGPSLANIYAAPSPEFVAAAPPVPPLPPLPLQLNPAPREPADGPVPRTPIALRAQPSGLRAPTQVVPPSPAAHGPHRRRAVTPGPTRGRTATPATLTSRIPLPKTPVSRSVSTAPTPDRAVLDTPPALPAAASAASASTTAMSAALAHSVAQVLERTAATPTPAVSDAFRRDLVFLRDQLLAHAEQRQLSTQPRVMNHGALPLMRGAAAAAAAMSSGRQRGRAATPESVRSSSALSSVSSVGTRAGFMDDEEGAMFDSALGFSEDSSTVAPEGKTDAEDPVVDRFNSPLGHLRPSSAQLRDVPLPRVMPQLPSDSPRLVVASEPTPLYPGALRVQVGDELEPLPTPRDDYEQGYSRAMHVMNEAVGLVATWSYDCTRVEMDAFPDIQTHATPIVTHALDLGGITESPRPIFVASAATKDHTIHRLEVHPGESRVRAGAAISLRGLTIDAVSQTTQSRELADLLDGWACTNAFAMGYIPHRESLYLVGGGRAQRHGMSVIDLNRGWLGTADCVFSGWDHHALVHVDGGLYGGSGGTSRRRFAHLDPRTKTAGGWTRLPNWSTTAILTQPVQLVYHPGTRSVLKFTTGTPARALVAGAEAYDIRGAAWRPLAEMLPHLAAALSGGGGSGSVLGTSAAIRPSTPIAAMGSVASARDRVRAVAVTQQWRGGPGGSLDTVLAVDTIGFGTAPDAVTAWSIDHDHLVRAVALPQGSSGRGAAASFPILCGHDPWTGFVSVGRDDEDRAVVRRVQVGPEVQLEAE
ncbi:Receptor-interacting serine/threonine-protein kinase 1 [Blastocladiella emersonii ATCC 22665]|nr:Receptor-interacting serine/threonine-protein kinase 1 [Blastocladiella emersonii ATCC 22665]